MGLFDFLFGKKTARKDEVPGKIHNFVDGQVSCSAVADSKTIVPFSFKSNCHQRYENGHSQKDLQKCIRTISVEKNINGCSGYRIKPGYGYIVKIYNNELSKPNMSDKPMRVISVSKDKIELQGYILDAMSPFGWQEVDYRDYGLTVYYSNGSVSKCIFHMFDRNVDIEYMNTVESNQGTTDAKISIKEVSAGGEFSIKFNDISVIKWYYNQTQQPINLATKVSAKMSRSSFGGDVEITFSDLTDLKANGVLNTNLLLSPKFIYNLGPNGDEFASAEINNSYEAIASGRDYVSLFQITKQKDRLLSFIINNPPGNSNFYYLIILNE